MKITMKRSAMNCGMSMWKTRFVKKRLIYARSYDARKVDDIIAAQLPKDVFLKHCDRVIDNNGVFEETKMQAGSDCSRFIRKAE